MSVSHVTSHHWKHKGLPHLTPRSSRSIHLDLVIPDCSYSRIIPNRRFVYKLGCALYRIKHQTHQGGSSVTESVSASSHHQQRAGSRLHKCSKLAGPSQNKSRSAYHIKGSKVVTDITSHGEGAQPSSDDRHCLSREVEGGLAVSQP